MMINKKVDLTGEVCPYTFVKSKLAIEKMKKGEVLEIVLDYKEAVENVPESMENHGHKVEEVEKTGNNKWKVIIKK
ncbi:hypothetical protein C9439_03385 [archaeon SCG-AAA382B04]|nr:hypothetical protein C9439_03385 [archaeon SCG-AAA382B04]